MRRRYPFPRVCLLLLPFLALARSHFLLTFPESRFPPFDFLDSERTVAPCGVPRSLRSSVTHFQTDKTYNITWRMSMDIKGKYRIRLININGEVDNIILKPDGKLLKEFRDDRNTQTVQARFPAECRNCTLVLEREIAELGQNVSERQCAEVDIVPASVDEFGESCSGNGRYLPEQMICRCDGGYSGELCQYKDDCVEDSDCGEGGRCLAEAIHRRQKSCFCGFGSFGTNCDKKSMSDQTDQGCFSYKGPDNSTRWYEAGLNLYNPDCYSLRNLSEAGDKMYWRMVGSHLEIVLDFHTNSWIGLGWRPLGIPPACRLFPQIRSQDGRNDDISKTSGFAPGVLEWPLHPMDCTDMVMASVRERNHLHIADMYSRDRATPLKDTWLDGEESLAAAYGLEKDGRMVVMFRRMVPEIEPTDHPLGPGELFVIWAKGQPIRKDGAGFYADGQWKYHGNLPNISRGHLNVEFVSQAQVDSVRGPLVHLEHGTQIRIGATARPPPKRITASPPAEIGHAEHVAPGHIAIGHPGMAGHATPDTTPALPTLLPTGIAEVVAVLEAKSNETATSSGSAQDGGNGDEDDAAEQMWKHVSLVGGGEAETKGSSGGGGRMMPEAATTTTTTSSSTKPAGHHHQQHLPTEHQHQQQNEQHRVAGEAKLPETANGTLPKQQQQHRVESNDKQHLMVNATTTTTTKMIPPKATKQQSSTTPPPAAIVHHHQQNNNNNNMNKQDQLQNKDDNNKKGKPEQNGRAKNISNNKMEQEEEARMVDENEVRRTPASSAMGSRLLLPARTMLSAIFPFSLIWMALI